MPLPRRPGPSVRVAVREIKGATALEHEDRLATEEPLEIRLAWPGRPAERIAVTMRTPGHDFELATGFLLAEGVLGGADDLRQVAYCTDRDLAPEEEFNVVTVELAGPPVRPPSVRYAGAGAATSACGVCGKQSIADALDVPHGPQHWDDLVVDASVLVGLPETLREQQKVFSTTGGLHAAGLFDADGSPLVVREDVGRHNAVDKVVGSRVLAGSTTGAPLMCVSGRVGFELAQKAAAAGVGVIVAVGAPSSLAVSFAKEAGLGVVGFARGERCVVYAAPERVGV